MISLAELAALFAIVFTLNIIPAFAPPTWLALSWIGFDHPQFNPMMVALVAALAATSGRIVLAKLSRLIIRQRFMSNATRANIDIIKDRIEAHRALTSGTFLVFAFSPFPSNYLFIAYGLTSLSLWPAAIPFFLGRCVTYTFFVFTAGEVSQHLVLQSSEARQYFGLYFVVTQCLFLGLVYLLTRIDWKHLVTARRVRWLRPPPDDPESV